MAAHVMAGPHVSKYGPLRVVRVVANHSYLHLMGRVLFPVRGRYHFEGLSGLELVMRYPARFVFPYTFNHKQSQYWPGFHCFIARPLGCCSSP